MSFESWTSLPFSVSLKLFFAVFTSLLEDSFSLGFGFSPGRSEASSLAFPSRFFFEGPACRSFKNAETSVVRFGYSNEPENERATGIDSSDTHIVRFVSLCHEILLIAGILSRLGSRERPPPVRGTVFLISDTSHNLQIQRRILCPKRIECIFPRLLRLPDCSAAVSLISRRQGERQLFPGNSGAAHTQGEFPPSVYLQPVGSCEESRPIWIVPFLREWVAVMW